MWLDGLEYEDWERKHEHDGLLWAVHGGCDEWALNNYKEGDTLVVWNQYNYDLEKVELIHCYIIRNDLYVDARGETDDFDELIDEFDYDIDNGHYKCKDINEFKKMIKEICDYKDKKWL